MQRDKVNLIYFRAPFIDKLANQVSFICVASALLVAVYINMDSLGDKRLGYLAGVP